MSNLTKFADYEASLDKKNKLKLLSRLSVYSFTLSIWIVLIIGFSISYLFNASFSSNFFNNFVVSFITAIVIVIPLGIIASFIILIAFEYMGGVGGGLALGVALGVIIACDSFSFTTTPPTGVPGAMAMGIMSGIGSSIIFGILTIFSGFNRGIGVSINIGTIFGIAAGIAGVIWGIIGVGISIGIIFGIAFGISLRIVHKFTSNTDFGIENCILFSIIGGVFTSFVIGTAGGIAESISFIIFYYRFSNIFSNSIKYIRAKYPSYQFDENTVKGRKSSVTEILDIKSLKTSVSQEQYYPESSVSKKSFIRHVYTVISQNQLLSGMFSGLVVLIVGIILQKIFQ